ncbi:minor capsid protein [Sporolactobacillus shoreicorticis]|uniref:Minor capsid protein n=1 Tax=Sporolactobacillus shoreicorticis TaxID=1923877 RepID=A0ABW5RYQ6_9BACL|nr:minor capsid protein [Sporolactobacillus shoreicorticis]MCO7125106.1 minor capsid protein [Sporolactobacillus shoreicorticis]
MSSYWENRMIQLYNAQDKRNTKLDKRLRKEYLRLEEQIKKEVASYYAKYAVNDVIEYRQLVLALSQSERDLLYKDYQEFARRYPQYQRLMPVRESIYRLNRLEGLQLSTRQRMVELGVFEQEGFEKLLKEAYSSGYLSTMKGLKNAPSFFSVSDDALQLTMNEKWIDGKNFSDRIWSNKEKLINTLNTEIRDAIIRGEDYQQMSQLIQHRMGVGAEDARRLIETESSFVMNQSNKKAFEDAGVERYEITAIMDRRTSAICKSMDGREFAFKDAKVGVNYPPFHPRCRTTAVPIENDREQVAANKMIEEAKKQEPAITAVLVSTAATVGASLAGLEYRIKSVESLTRKIESEGNKKIRDILRYTTIADPNELVDHYYETVELLKENGYTETVVKNYWNNPVNPYNGINTFVKNADGYEFELQYHTAESFALKNGKLHDLYEKWRVIGDKASKEAVALAKEMATLSKKLKRPARISEVN